MLVFDGIASGMIQIPDFQHNRRVTEKHVTDLLHTMGEGLPIGDVILIETNGESRTGFQAVRGTDTVTSQNRHPTHLIVDGQQRLVPLFQSLHS
ncbi:MAG: DUF262 domain-containing protein [Oxalobacteraceae bacterium]|nr:MAG: DUF262 domain-containing protein [Oxalobacteraceae bacterium]